MGIKRLISLALVLAVILVLLSFNPVEKNQYLASIYPQAKIKEADFDQELNSRECFVEHAYEVADDKLNLHCYFIKSMGYEDFVHYMVEIDGENARIEKVHLIEDNETDDYGGYLREGWFLERFENMSLTHPAEIVKIRKENDYEVVAITGATITSLSASRAVNLAMENYKN